MIDRCFTFGIVGFALVACAAHGLTPEDAQNVRDIQADNAMAYAIKDASTPGAQLDRAAYCSADAILARNQLAGMDAGIGCAR